MSRQERGLDSDLDRLAREVVQVGLDDLTGLARVHARLEVVTDQTEEEFPAAAPLAGVLATATENVIMEEYGEVDDPLDIIRCGIEMLRRLCRGLAEGTSGEPDDPDVLREIEALAVGEPEPGEDSADALSNDDVEEPLEEAETEGAAEEGDTDGSAPEKELPEALELIARDIMLIDPDDLSGLGNIHTGFEELTEGLRGSRPVYAGVAECLARAVQNIIVDECGGIEDPVDVVARGVGMLQRMQVAYEGNGKDAQGEPDLVREIACLAGEEIEGLPADTEVEAEKAAVVGDGPEAEVRAPEKAPEAGGPSVLPPDMDADIFFDFASEAEEHLGSAESTLLSLESSPDDAELLNTVFRSFHTIKGAAGFLNLQDVTRVAHCVEDVLDSVRKRKLKFTSLIEDVALESIDLLRGLIAGVRTQLEGGPAAPTRDVSGFVAKVKAASSGAPAPAQPAADASGESPQPEAPATPGPATPSPGDTGPAAPTPGASPKGQPAGAGHKNQQFVRVGTEKLDQLVSMVGELVISQTQVTQNPTILGMEDQRLARDMGQMGRITRDLQEVAMSMRMVPIKSTFERMARMVRDLARKCGKEVEFRMSGEDTELDKNVVEELVDPLTHMIRNAVDHGVEAAEARKAAGKPERGLVTLDARHQGGNIVIELRDDGKGLDRERVKKKAVERGLVSADAELTDAEVYDLIFRAGFSTAEVVSDVSGRGVGMDVVRRSIEKLRGKTEVDSKTGIGSTFTIRLPLTLAIIDGMIIGVGQERYVLPLTSIVRALRPSQDQVFTVKGEGEMVKVHGDLYPLVRLHRRFDTAPKYDCPWEGLVVLIEAVGGACCLMVDELLGIQPVVIKGLSDELRHDKSLSGCTILGDGQVCLILDANGLANQTNGKSGVAVEEAPGLEPTAAQPVAA